jgi:hypothetical protein
VALVRVLGNRVFGLSSADVPVCAGAATLVLIVPVVAAMVPAMQVLRTDPVR